MKRAIVSVITAKITNAIANNEPDAANPVAPAQKIDANASAKVETFEAVWRRRNWLRVAEERNQS